MGYISCIIYIYIYNPSLLSPYGGFYAEITHLSGGSPQASPMGHTIMPSGIQGQIGVFFYIEPAVRR